MLETKTGFCSSSASFCFRCTKQDPRTNPSYYPTRVCNIGNVGRSCGIVSQQVFDTSRRRDSGRHELRGVRRTREKRIEVEKRRLCGVSCLLCKALAVFVSRGLACTPDDPACTLAHTRMHTYALNPPTATSCEETTPDFRPCQRGADRI